MVTKAEIKMNNCVIFIPNLCGAFHTKIFWQKITTKADKMDFDAKIGYYIGFIDGNFGAFDCSVKDIEEVKILTLFEAYRLYENK